MKTKSKVLKIIATTGVVVLFAMAGTASASGGHQHYAGCGHHNHHGHHGHYSHHGYNSHQVHTYHVSEHPFIW